MLERYGQSSAWAGIGEVSRSRASKQGERTEVKRINSKGRKVGGSSTYTAAANHVTHLPTVILPSNNWIILSLQQL